MKKFKVSFSLKTSIGSMDTVINANNASQAKTMIEGQYGSNLKRIISINELR